MKIEMKKFTDELDGSDNVSSSTKITGKQPKAFNKLKFLRTNTKAIKIPNILRKPSVMIICKKSFKFLIIASIIGIIGLLIFLAFKLLALFISNIGAFTVFLFCLYKLGRFLCTVAVFPGSFWFWR